MGKEMQLGDDVSWFKVVDSAGAKGADGDGGSAFVSPGAGRCAYMLRGDHQQQQEKISREHTVTANGEASISPGGMLEAGSFPFKGICYVTVTHVFCTILHYLGG